MADAREVISDTLTRIGCSDGERCDHDADAILRALDAAGYTPPLPKKATEAMRVAGFKARFPNDEKGQGTMTDIWRAMVAAAGRE